jgi:hypothetical protein
MLHAPPASAFAVPASAAPVMPPRLASLGSGLALLPACALACALALPAPATAQSSDDVIVPVARVKYGGGGDWYSDEQSLVELLRFVQQETGLGVAAREDVVELSSDKVFAYPYLYLTGHGNVRLTPREANRLRSYLLGGGFLHIDDNYGLDASIRRELKKVFPERELVEVPFDHPVYHTAFDFPDGLPKVHEHDGQPPQGFGLFDDAGRLMVFYSYESDLGDGWEPPSVHDNPPATRRAALQMGANLVTYAMTH